MAWSFVGVSTAVEVASGDVAPTEPAGVATGDLLVACIAYRSNVAFSMPSGWTQIEVQNTGDTDATDGIASLVMAYIVRGASAPALTFTRTGGDLAIAQIVAYRGGKATGVLGTHSSATAAALTNTPTTPSITTSAANSLLVVMTACGDGRTTSAFDATDPATASGATDTTTAPTAGTWIERADFFTGTGADGALAIGDAIRAAAGATGTVQCTTGGNAGRHAMAVAEFLIDTGASAGSLAVTLADTTVAATGTLPITGTLAVTLADATVAATGESGAADSGPAGFGGSMRRMPRDRRYGSGLNR